MQPLHMEGLDDPATPSSWVDGLSAGRYERGFRAGDLARAGALIPLGSDWFVADFDPRVGLAWAQLRRTPGRPDLVPYLPAQALDAETALRGYTTAAARVAGDEDVCGRLRPGPARRHHRARRAIRSRSRRTSCRTSPCGCTVVDGDVVFAA